MSLRQGEKKWVNVWDILPLDPTYNRSTYGVHITDYGTSDIDDGYFTIPYSEAKRDPDLVAPLYLPKKGAYFPQEKSTVPRRFCKGSENNILIVKFFRNTKTIG